MVRKIVETIPEEQLQNDLEKYRQRAIELGATDAKIIAADQVIIDERVLAKCTYPKCDHFGTSANCPPYAMSLDQVRKVVNNFKHAIFIKLEVPSKDIAGTEARERGFVNSCRIELAEIIAKIESEAFYDGYHLALAFGSGPCKTIFCPDTECSALITGQGCRYGLKARSSMEAVGMDCFTMTARAGWNIYPIGHATLPEEVTCGLRLALVLIT